MPASASEALMIFMKSRREVPSPVHSEACRGNSRCSISSNSGVPDNSSSVRQYFGPFASDSFSRTSASSSFSLFPGQTSGPPWLFVFRSLSIRSSVPLLDSSWLCAFIPPRLAMAGVAARNVANAAHVVSRLQISAEFDLVLEFAPADFHHLVASWLNVIHVEDLIARPKVLLRRPMAVQTPLHLQRGVAVHQRHLVHWAVAGIATHTFINANADVGVDEIRQAIGASTHQR